MSCLLQMLRVVPDASWLAAFDDASVTCMSSFTPQGLGDILAAQVGTCVCVCQQRVFDTPSCVLAEEF
jgi:hypothetical protein